jgi:hypothetical protein
MAFARRTAVLLLVAAGAAVADPPAFAPIDYAKVERRIGKEPAYVGKPRYAHFVFDAAGTHRVWAVIDQSDPEKGWYDVLYLDRDGDGDLTEEGERLTTTYREAGEPAGIAVDFKVGDVVVPGTGEKHTDFRISTKPKKGREGVWFQMKWRGEVQVSGGYGLRGIHTTRWSDAPATAPILRPTPEGPLTFATYGAAEHVLTPGESHHVSVLVGHAGLGDDALCIVDEHFLKPEGDRLFVTVLAKDAKGREVRERTQIKGHC